MIAFLGRFGYVAVLVALLAAGLGVPIPEELTQLVAGALSHEGILDLRIVVPLVWAGILVGDTLLFLIARRAGPRVLAWRHAARLMTPRRRELLERHFARHAFLTIAIARHAGGVRYPAFALAGATRVRLRTFVLADGLSALLSVPLVVGTGYLLWHHLLRARKDVRLVELAVASAVAVAVLVVHLVRSRRRARRGRGARASRDSDRAAIG